MKKTIAGFHRPSVAGLIDDQIEQTIDYDAVDGEVFATFRAWWDVEEEDFSNAVRLQIWDAFRAYVNQNSRV